MKTGDKIAIYNIKFIKYTFQLDWRNNVLCYKYY